MTARIEPTKDRPVPGPSIEAQLVAEVDRTAARHEAALLDLRRWRISHPTNSAIWQAEKEAEAKERMKAGVANPKEIFPEGTTRQTRDELGDMAGHWRCGHTLGRTCSTGQRGPN